MAYHPHILTLKNASKLIFVIAKGQNFRIESFKALCDTQTWKFQECSICSAEAINTDLIENSSDNCFYGMVTRYFISKNILLI